MLQKGYLQHIARQFINKPLLILLLHPRTLSAGLTIFIGVQSDPLDTLPSSTF
jgi:hypothetical protein